MAIHKGTEPNNIKETWDQNERNKHADQPFEENTAGTGVGEELQRVIKEESADYDNTRKEETILGGDRATIDDDQS